MICSWASAALSFYECTCSTVTTFLSNSSFRFFSRSSRRVCDSIFIFLAFILFSYSCRCWARIAYSRLSSISIFLRWICSSLWISSLWSISAFQVTNSVSSLWFHSRSFSRFSSSSSAFLSAKASLLTAAAVSLTGASTLSKLGTGFDFCPLNFSSLSW